MSTPNFKKPVVCKAQCKGTASGGVIGAKLALFLSLGLDSGFLVDAQRPKVIRLARGGIQCTCTGKQAQAHYKTLACDKQMGAVESESSSFCLLGLASQHLSLSSEGGGLCLGVPAFSDKPHCPTYGKHRIFIAQTFNR